MKWVFLTLLLLIIAAFVIINTDWGQNIILSKVTQRLSKNLNTRIRIGHVSFSLFNKMSLEDVLIEDQKEDTLLFAGNIKVRITDWFFIKDKIVLHYAGLEDAVININRADSLWNYQFIVDYFSGGSTSGKKEAINLDLKKIVLKNIKLEQLDKWRGENKIIHLATMDLDAKEINFATKTIQINSLYFTEPYFYLKNYAGLKPKKIKAIAEDENIPAETELDSTLKWNPDEWLVHIDKMKIKNGEFKNEKVSDSPYYDYFDGRYIDFASIEGTFTNIRVIRDSITYSIDLKTKERSGFEVKEMTADVKFTPQEMTFDKLDIRTNNSIIRDYFSMRFNDFDDLGDFIEKVRMQARFDDAEIDSDDIAYFAPALKTWNKRIKISGTPRGTVDDIFANELTIEAGGKTYLDGDISLSGLPDIQKTFIDFKANSFRTTYADARTFFPGIRKVTTPRLNNISYLTFRGSFTGFLKDFVTFGTIQTNLGTITSDLNMKLPDGKDPFYSGNIASKNFNLGRFLYDSTLGEISFSGQVKGKGFQWNTLAADLDMKINYATVNNYHYENIVAKGSVNEKYFNGNLSINDTNLVAVMNGIIDFREDVPKFNLVSTIDKLNLEKLNLANQSIGFKGKLDFDFRGNNPDNFLGRAKITDAELSRNGHVLPLDSLIIYSGIDDGVRNLQVRSKELEASIAGDYTIMDLPDAFKYFLNRYYPSYIDPPRGRISNQNFTFSIKTNYISEYLNLIDSSLDGLNNSEITGKLNTSQNQLQLQANVPDFIFKGYEFQNITLNSNGQQEKLDLTTTIDNIVVNDSISFPYTKIDLTARNDSTQFRLNTESNNKNIPEGSINALVTTYEDGFAVLFDTSQFVLNGKRWSIQKNGELEFRSNKVSYSEIILKESNQEVKIKTNPSDIGNWNNLEVDLNNFNIGDVATFLLKSNKIEGLVSGKITVEDPVNKFNVVSDLQTEQLRLDNDSIGQVKAHVYYNNKTGELTANGKNLNPDEKIDFNLNLFLKDLPTNGQDTYTITPVNYPIKIVERFIGDLFTDLRGYATGQLKIIGTGKNTKYIGKAKLHDAGLRVKFTQCFYKINDAEINFLEDRLDLGRLKLVDTVTNHTATLSRGIIKHNAWRNMVFDIKAEVDNEPILLLNTGPLDNSSFYGNARGTGSFEMTGPQSNTRMKIVGEASRTDSSYITIPNSTSRQSGIADFLIERKYGREISDTAIGSNETNLTYDVDITGNPMVNIKVVLDELTRDEIRGRGQGNLKIVSGTSEPLSIRGRYNINDGFYRFTFQSFFGKNFILKKEANNYIEWNGDPYNPTTYIEAVYKTEKKVDFSPLLNSSPSGASPESVPRDNVYVIAKLSGNLFEPDIKFDLEFPPESAPNQNVSVAFIIDQLKSNENELNKQVAFLVVFNSFAPTDAGSSLGLSSGVDLFVNSISGFLSGQINKVLNDILSNKLKIPGLYVNFSGALYNPNPFGQDNNGALGFDRTNFNVAVGKRLFNNRVVLTFEGNYDVPLQAGTSTQFKTDLLTNFTTEFLINKSGTLRATIFYKENVDFLTNTISSGSSKSKRYGGSFAYKKEFNRLADIFKKRKKIEAIKQEDEKSVEEEKN